MNFKDWIPLKLVDSDLLSRVRLAYVFGKTGHEALIVTDEDEVLACGTNLCNCLGLESEETQIKPVIIPELSKKKIKGFSSTVSREGTFVCAYTFGGTLYYWGKNFLASNTPITKTPNVFPEFSKKVCEVACGHLHSLILSAEGEVFSFGNNGYGQLGNGTINNSDVPTLIQGKLKRKNVVKISCGSLFSVCVLDIGKVYAWGYNDCNQLGWSSQTHDSLKSPTKVPELNHVIRKVVCGSSHVMAISDVGELFTWGSNNVGQLGTENGCISRYTPRKIKTIGKVINIAALPVDSTSAAMTENAEVYMWGYCGGLKLTVPTKTQFETLHDVFAYFGDPRIMHKPMNRLFQLESVGESVKNHFGDVETSDLTIVAEDKKIFVHTAVLKFRSNYFKLLLQEPWIKEDDKIIKIDQNYDGIHAYLQYIYTGHLKTTPEVALELLRITDEYNDEVLKEICEKSIRHGIAVENVASLYSLALKLGAKKLAKYCLSFAGNHIGEVIQTSGFNEWDKDTFKEFVLECYKQKLFRY